jgi:hypothetical protein
MSPRDSISLLLLIVFGCAKDVVKTNIGDVVFPDVIDIGQVRVKDSPAKTSFTIANHSPIPVEIEEVSSGCGCTVIALQQKTIKPNETLEIPLKIDLFGRGGDFATDILVQSTAEQAWHIRVIGKVIEDIWYAGQSIRLYVDQEQEFVSKDFTISTIDYPDIQFECKTSDSDVCLSELSRSTQEGETDVLFRVTVHNANGFCTSSSIDLIPTNVDLPRLIIPVYLHYLTGEHKQWLTTSQINLGEIKQNESVVAKVYGDGTFLWNVHRIHAESKDEGMTVVSFAMSSLDSDCLELFVVVGDNYQGLFRGSLTLFSQDEDESTVRVSGIVVIE